MLYDNSLVLKNSAWANWGSRRSCSQTCGGGTQSCALTCTNPALVGSGSSCYGDSTSIQLYPICSMYVIFLILPVNGAWADWGSWGSCSQTCGGGTQSRTRTCTNPAPVGSGSSCSGDSTSSQSCNTQNCPCKFCRTEIRNLDFQMKFFLVKKNTVILGDMFRKCHCTIVVIIANLLIHIFHTLFITWRYIMRKGRCLFQSFDKNTYSNRKIQKATDDTILLKLVYVTLALTLDNWYA